MLCGIYGVVFHKASTPEINIDGLVIFLCAPNVLVHFQEER